MCRSLDKVVGSSSRCSKSNGKLSPARWAHSNIEACGSVDTPRTGVSSMGGTPEDTPVLGPLQHRGLWVGGYAENGSVLRGAAHGVGDDGGEVDRDGGFPHAALLIGNDMHVCHVLPPYASWPGWVLLRTNAVISMPGTDLTL